MYRETLQPFKRIDLEILQSCCEVQEVCCKLAVDRSDLIRIWRGMRWADQGFCWFADKHALYAAMIARALRKKCMVVSGGYDTAYIPALHYGLQTGRRVRFIPRLAHWFADAVVVHSEQVRDEVLARSWANPRKVHLVYLGLSSGDFYHDPRVKKEGIALTVSGVDSTKLVQKGLLTFVQSARYVPEARFVVVGKCNADAKSRLVEVAGPNVEFTGYLPDRELLQLYRRSKVYVQVSLHAGFGMALAEAMLCECAPVVTELGALPEVVGDCGFYVAPEDPRATGVAIRSAMASTIGPEARARIAARFPLEWRRARLTALVQGLSNGDGQTGRSAAGGRWSSPG